jgi:hypothetical protein
MAACESPTGATFNGSLGAFQKGLSIAELEKRSPTKFRERYQVHPKRKLLELLLHLYVEISLDRIG